MVVKPKNKYFIYFYSVYLNDVLFCEFARESRAIDQAHELAKNRPDANITVMRRFDWEFTVASVLDILIFDNMRVQRLICRVKGHMWDADRPFGGIHERNICWRCGAVSEDETQHASK